jgi:hypothetical protein
MTFDQQWKKHDLVLGDLRFSEGMIYLVIPAPMAKEKSNEYNNADKAKLKEEVYGGQDKPTYTDASSAPPKDNSVTENYRTQHQ